MRPGKVATDMVEKSAREKEKAERKEEMLRPEDVAASIYWCLTQPARCNIVAAQIWPHMQVI